MYSAQTGLSRPVNSWALKMMLRVCVQIDLGASGFNLTQRRCLQLCISIQLDAYCGGQVFICCSIGSSDTFSFFLWPTFLFNQTVCSVEILFFIIKQPHLSRLSGFLKGTCRSCSDESVRWWWGVGGGSLCLLLVLAALTPNRQVYLLPAAESQRNMMRNCIWISY